jgi:two-component system, LuxR family, sensor kinase FixL
MQRLPCERANAAGSLRISACARFIQIAQLLTSAASLPGQSEEVTRTSRIGTPFSYAMPVSARGRASALPLGKLSGSLCERQSSAVFNELFRSHFMPRNEESQSGESQVWADALVRPLSRRYLLVVASVAALVLVDQAILQPLLVQLNFYAPVINMAGRQRMLSQKLTKEVLALLAMDEKESRAARRDELRSTVEQWTIAHRTLLEGNLSEGVQPVETGVQVAIHHVEPAFETMRLAVDRIATDGSPHDSSGISQDVAAILKQEPIYLRGMEQVVAQLESSAQARVAWLRGCGLAAMLAVLLLLMTVYFHVLRPAATLIRRQVAQLAVSETRHRLLAEMLGEARDELEVRVAERTRDLSQANAALEREMGDRQATELRMRELSNELAHMSRVTALGQLATGLAHEINQPLATVANYAGTLELTLKHANPPDPQTEEMVSQIQRAALRAGAIVRRMRSFARRTDLQMVPVELNDLIREVCELCRPELQNAKVQLSLELAPQPVSVLADALQLQQVLVNLVQNAIQAIGSSSATQRRVCIRLNVELEEVTVTVVDTGPGFATSNIEKCFESFYSTRPDGLGMGLSISRSIIQQHQGRIWSANRESGGAVVGFSLPLIHLHENSTEQHADRVCG